MKEEVKEYKLITDEPYLFSNYHFTDLMLLKKNGRNYRGHDNFALMEILNNKLEDYGISIKMAFERDGLTFRGVYIHEGFPIENEEIISQLYGYNGLIVPLILTATDDYAANCEYNVDVGDCELQKNVYGITQISVKYECLADMLIDIRTNGYDLIFSREVNEE